MRRIEVVRPPPLEPVQEASSSRRRFEGAARWAPASPPDASVWMDVVELEAGARIECDAGGRIDCDASGRIDCDAARAARDEAIYVVCGALSIGGRLCPEGGAVVIERGGRCRAEAVGRTRLLHMGSAERAGSSRAATASAPPAAAAPSHVHVVGPRGRFEACEPGRVTHFFADATCATCAVWLLRTGRDFAYESPVHSHSRDELIHVLHGEIAIGSLAVGPGETLFVAADQPYRFRARAGGFAFVNFRSGPSQMTMRATGERIVENAHATGMTPVIEDGVAAWV